MEEQQSNEATPPTKVEGAEQPDEGKAEDDGPPTPSSPAANTNAANTKAANTKCAKCGKRFARRGCTQSACLACCEDKTCATHNEAREHALWKEQVLAGTTPQQLIAKEKRSKAIPAGRFREQDFSYMGDTVVLWDLDQFFGNPAWREDAIRKSKKRRTRQLNHDLSTGLATTKLPTKKNRRQRFHDTFEALYNQTLS